MYLADTYHHVLISKRSVIRQIKRLDEATIGFNRAPAPIMFAAYSYCRQGHQFS